MDYESGKKLQWGEQDNFVWMTKFATYLNCDIETRVKNA